MTTFAYDVIDQLLSESRNGYSASYTYDANGNRASKTLNGVTQTYVNDAGDKLTSVLQGVTPVKSFTYDAAGRTTAISESGVVTNFAYDYEDRITQITRSGMTTNTFSYNGFGARVSAVDSSGTRTFARNGTGVTAPVLGDGMANYTPGISERRGGVTRYQSSDIKNATAQVSSSQTVVGTKQYDAFGNLTSSSGSWNGPFSYGGAFGYQTETDTGYQLLGHRYYDPTTGRFLTRDPIGDGRNWYTYCGNNPINAADPTGTILWFVVIPAAALAIGALATTSGCGACDMKSRGERAEEALDDKRERQVEDPAWDIDPGEWPDGTEERLFRPDREMLDEALDDAEGAAKDALGIEILKRLIPFPLPVIRLWDHRKNRSMFPVF